VQVDPMKPMLKPLGTKHLKLKCDILISTFAFKFNVRRYSWGKFLRSTDPDILIGYNIVNFDFPYLINRAAKLGVEDFPYWVGRRRLTLG